MKLEYVANGSEQCPLLRLFDFDKDEAQLLHQAFDSLATGRAERVELEFIRSIDGSCLTFVKGPSDIGVVILHPQHFELILDSEGWRQASDEMSPFCHGSAGYQWLVPHTQGISFLLSKSGDW